MLQQAYTEYLKGLGFVPVETSGRKFVRGRFKITISRNQRRTVIVKEISHKDFDWQENHQEQEPRPAYMPVYRGGFIFDDIEFTRGLFLRIGIIKNSEQ